MTALVLGLVMAGALADLLIRLAPAPRLVRRPVALGPGARRAGAVVVIAALAMLALPLAVAVPIGWWMRRRLRAVRATAERARLVREALPDVVDLLVLATSAGLALPVAHPLVAFHAPSPLRECLEAAQARTAAGAPRADALVDALAPLGERAHHLGHVLADHLRYGVPLLPGLERASLELRLHRRRQAEMAARRVPVRLLAPLVSCVLPAFALLTVVPLLAASLDALPT